MATFGLLIKGRDSRWRSRQCFRDQIDLRIKRKWDEREYCHEISGRADNLDEMDRNYLNYKR